MCCGFDNLRTMHMQRVSVDILCPIHAPLTCNPLNHRIITHQINDCVGYNASNCDII